MKISGGPRGLVVIGALLAVCFSAWSVATGMQLRHEIANVSAVVQHQAQTPEDARDIAQIVYHLPFLEAREAARWSPTGYATIGVAGTVLSVLFLIVGLRRSRP